MESLKNTLRRDLQSIGDTKRNPENIKLLYDIYNSLMVFFNKSEVSVDVDTDSGFNSLGFISIKGNNITIDNKIVFDLILKYSSYINVFFDDNVVDFEIGYTWLIKPERATPVRDVIKNTDLKYVESVVFDLCDEVNAISINKIGDLRYSILCDELSIKANSVFWELLCCIDSMSINNKDGKIELNLKISDNNE